MRKNRNIGYNITTQAKPQYTTTEEVAAFSLFHTSSEEDKPEIAERILLHNLLSVVAIAKRIHNGIGGSLDDMIDIGAMKVYGMIWNFDPTRKVKFVAYFAPTVYRHIFSEVYNIGQVDYPKKWVSLSNTIRKARRELEQGAGRALEVADIIEIDTPEEEAFYSFIMNINYDYIDGSSTDYEGGGEFHPVDQSIRPDEALEEREMKECVETAVGELPHPINVVVREAFGINGSAPQSMEKIGRLIGVSGETARQAKEKGIRILRDNPRINEIYSR